MIRQCPRCDLRFPTDSELSEHLATDHHADPGVIGRHRYPGAHADEPLYHDLDAGASPPRRYLVVANQTLETDALTGVLSDRLAAGPSAFMVVVPATHSADYRAPGGSATGVSAATDEDGTAQARWRLQRSVEALRARGVVAVGEIGPPDPYDAAGRILERQPIDEVIIGTLPPDRSRWCHLDMPTRIRRRFGVPVTVVTSPAAAPVPSPR